MVELIVTTKNELKETLRHVIQEINDEARKKQEERLWTVNQVALRLKRAHATIKKLVQNGTLKTTKDGLILESSIEEYLNR